MENTKLKHQSEISKSIEIIDWDFDEKEKYPFSIRYTTSNNEEGEYEEEMLSENDLVDILKHLLLIDGYKNGCVLLKTNMEQLPNGSYEHVQKEIIETVSLVKFMRYYVKDMGIKDIVIVIEQQKCEDRAKRKLQSEDEVSKTLGNFFRPLTDIYR